MTRTQPGGPPLPPTRLVEAIDGAAAQVRAGLRELYPVALGLQLIPSIPALLLVPAHVALRDEQVLLTLANLGLSLAVAALSLWVQVPLVQATWDGLQGRATSVRRCLATGLRLRNILALVATYLVIGIGYAVCLVPGLVLTVWLALVPAVLVVEDAGLDALTRSYRLVRAPVNGRRINGWRVVAVLTVVAALGASFALVSSLPAAIYTGMEGLTGFFTRMAEGRPLPPTVELTSTLLAIPLNALRALLTSAWLLALLRLVREEQEATELLAVLRGDDAA